MTGPRVPLQLTALGNWSRPSSGRSGAGGARNRFLQGGENWGRADGERDLASGNGITTGYVLLFPAGQAMDWRTTGAHRDGRRLSPRPPPRQTIPLEPATPRFSVVWAAPHAGKQPAAGKMNTGLRLGAEALSRRWSTPQSWGGAQTRGGLVYLASIVR